MITFVWHCERSAQRNRRKSTDLDRPALAALNSQGAHPPATPRLLTLRRVCHFCSAGLPTQRLSKLRSRSSRSCRALSCAATRSPACTENPPLCSHPCINPTVSLLSNPRRSNSPSTRCRTAACTRSTHASSTSALRNTSPYRPCATTPSSMHRCKCTSAFRPDLFAEFVICFEPGAELFARGYVHCFANFHNQNSSVVEWATPKGCLARIENTTKQTMYLLDSLDTLATNARYSTTKLNLQQKRFSRERRHTKCISSLISRMTVVVMRRSWHCS